MLDPREKNRQYPIVEEKPPIEAQFSYEEKSFVARWNGLTYKNVQQRVDFWEVGKEHLVRKAHLANRRLSHCGEGEAIGIAASKAVGLL